MSVSMPNFVASELDFTKLALFLGDEYVLKQFGRLANSYAVSAIRKIKQNLTPTDVVATFDLMRQGLNKMAGTMMADSRGFGKYTSINPKQGYIEFRSAGGENYMDDLKLLQNTLMRYARAMAIAMDPEAEKKEYAKKYYKLLTNVALTQTTDPKTGRQRVEVQTDDIIRLFSQYSAGSMSAYELKMKIWSQVNSRKSKQPDDKEVSSDNSNGNSIPPRDSNGNYEIYQMSTGLAIYRFSASSNDDALNVLSQWKNSEAVSGLNLSNFSVRGAGSATPLAENFADGKVKGKSRPGRVKKAGASCDGSVTDLRSKAKRASGEKAKMYHWCANMKSGKSK
jgi:hypothetical protein